MSVDKHHSEELNRYLNGEMTPLEANALERKALDDPFLQEAMEGAESLTSDKFIEDVAYLNARLLNKKKPKIVIWKVAAVVALLVMSVFSAWWLIDTSPPSSLASKDSTSESLPTIVPRDSIEESAIAANETIELEETPVPKAPDVNSPPVARQEAMGETTEVVLAEPLTSSSAVVNKVDDFFLEEVQEEEAIEKPQLAIARNMKEEQQAGAARRAKTNEASRSDASSAKQMATRQQTNANVRRITGTVTDISGESLPGVNVVIKGTTTGVTTDLDGNFELEISSDREVLVISSVGMKSKEVEVGSRSEINMELNYDNAALQEIVVTGYGSFDNDPVGFVEANPVGGLTEFKDYLEQNLFYPEEAISKGIEGRVVLQITISPSGNFADIEVKRGLGYGCDEEAIRLIKQGPRWSPATRDGINVETKVRVRVIFELE